jgi:hypothetical protein
MRRTLRSRVALSARPAQNSTEMSYIRLTFLRYGGAKIKELAGTASTAQEVQESEVSCTRALCQLNILSHFGRSIFLEIELRTGCGLLLLGASPLHETKELCPLSGERLNSTGQ